METNESTTGNGAEERDEIAAERCSIYAKELAKKYREMIAADMAAAPENLRRRILCGTFAMEVMDMSCDLFAIGAIRAASESGSPSRIMGKIIEVLTEGVHNYGECAQSMLLLSMKNVIEQDGLQAPEVVCSLLARAIESHVNERTAMAMKQSD